VELSVWRYFVVMLNAVCDSNRFGDDFMPSQMISLRDLKLLKPC